MLRKLQNACNNPHWASSDPGSDAGSVPGQEGHGGCWWLWWDTAGAGRFSS